jgi:predicted transport protein
MSTEFKTVESAKKYVAMKCDINIKDIKEEDNKTILQKMGEFLNPNSIRNKDQDKTFTFINKEGKTVKILITPFRSGFDCWVVGENGWSVRI